MPYCITKQLIAHVTVEISCVAPELDIPTSRVREGRQTGVSKPMASPFAPRFVASFTQGYLYTSYDRLCKSLKLENV